MRLATLAVLLSAAACGQGPSFTDDSTSDGKSPSSAADANAAAGGEQGLSGEDDDGTDGSDGSDGADGSDGGDDAEGDAGEGDEPLDIPDASPEDADAISRCMKNWKNAPFGGTVTNFKRTFASVTVGGFGSAISDTERTDEPWLILIDAGVNVLGSPKYELLNPNGWYCIKVNVNVIAELTVDLHCSARLADSKVNVNVGSDQSGATSAVGVHVLSDVKVNDVRPEGDSCIR